MIRPQVRVDSNGVTVVRAATDAEMLTLMRTSVFSAKAELTRKLVAELLAGLGPERWILYMTLAEQLKDLDPETASAIAELINRDIPSK
jgi:hypothetical protein